MVVARQRGDVSVEQRESPRFDDAREVTLRAARAVCRIGQRALLVEVTAKVGEAPQITLVKFLNRLVRTQIFEFSGRC